MLNYFNELEKYDSEVFAACNKEFDRQQTFIELIASENIVSKAVLLAAGSAFSSRQCADQQIRRRLPR